MKRLTALIALSVVAMDVAWAQTTPPNKLRSNDAFTQVDNYLVAAKRLGIPTGTSPSLNASVSAENSGKLFYDTDDRVLMVYDPVASAWRTLTVDITAYYTRAQVDSIAALYLPKAGGTMNGSINMNGDSITNAAVPLSAGNGSGYQGPLATIPYVDSVAGAIGPPPSLQSVTENGKTTNQGIDITSGGLDVQPYLSVIDNEATGNQMSFNKDLDGLLKVHFSGSPNTYSFMADNHLGLYRNSALIAHLTTNSDPKPVLFLRSGLTSSSNAVSLRAETTPASTSNTLTMPAVTDTLATKGMLATYIPRGNVQVSDIYTSTPATANRLIAFNGSNATWQPSLQYAIGNGDAALPSSIVQRSTTGAIYAKDLWMVDTSIIRNAGSISVVSRSSSVPNTNGKWQVQGSVGGQYTTPNMEWSWSNGTNRTIRHSIGNQPNNSTDFLFLTRISDNPAFGESSTVKLRLMQGDNNPGTGDQNMNVAQFSGSVLGRMPSSVGNGSGYYGNYATRPYVDSLGTGFGLSYNATTGKFNWGTATSLGTGFMRTVSVPAEDIVSIGNPFGPEPRIYVNNTTVGQNVSMRVGASANPVGVDVSATQITVGSIGGTAGITVNPTTGLAEYRAAVNLSSASDRALVDKGYVGKMFSYTTSGDGIATTFSVPHGLTYTPSMVMVTPNSADVLRTARLSGTANGVFAAYGFYATVDATNVNIIYPTGTGGVPPAGTDNLSWTILVK